MKHIKKYQNGGKLDEDKENRRKKKRRIRKLKRRLKGLSKGAAAGIGAMAKSAGKGAAKGIKGLGMKRMENGGKMKKMKKKTIADQSRYQAMDYTKGGKSTGRAHHYGDGNTVRGTLREATSSGDRRNIYGKGGPVKKNGYYDIMDKKDREGLHSRDKAG